MALVAARRSFIIGGFLDVFDTGGGLLFQHFDLNAGIIAFESRFERFRQIVREGSHHNQLGLQGICGHTDGKEHAAYYARDFIH